MHTLSLSLKKNRVCVRVWGLPLGKWWGVRRRSGTIIHLLLRHYNSSPPNHTAAPPILLSCYFIVARSLFRRWFEPERVLVVILGSGQSRHSAGESLCLYVFLLYLHCVVALQQPGQLPASPDSHSPPRRESIDRCPFQSHFSSIEKSLLHIYWPHRDLCTYIVFHMLFYCV